MRIQEEYEKIFLPKISVYLDDVKTEDRDEIASMLRGLMCAIEGWGQISGLTNEYFTSNSPVILNFTRIDNAHYFKSCVEYYFSDDILRVLSIKKRIVKKKN